MSRHLRVLRAGGLVEVVTPDERDARLRVYRLRPEPFACLKDWVDHAAAFWTGQLESFKSHVERNASKIRIRKKGAKT
jgi:DNA-binding transcriptional ArsR family regulator